MVLFIVELSVTFSVEKNKTLNTTLNSTNLDTLVSIMIHRTFGSNYNNGVKLDAFKEYGCVVLP